MRVAVSVACLAIAACSGGPVEQAKEAVAAELRDPQSAQFRNVKICPSGKIVAGDVNAKNAFGGYAGFEPFFYADGEVAFVSNPKFSRLSSECYPRTGKETPAEAAARNLADELDASADAMEGAGGETAR